MNVSTSNVWRSKMSALRYGANVYETYETYETSDFEVEQSRLPDVREFRYPVEIDEASFKTYSKGKSLETLKSENKYLGITSEFDKFVIERFALGTMFRYISNLRFTNPFGISEEQRISFCNTGVIFFEILFKQFKDGVIWEEYDKDILKVLETLLESYRSCSLYAIKQYYDPERRTTGYMAK